MLIVNTHEAKTHLSHLLNEIERRHETVRICRNGKAIAELVPISPLSKNPLLQCDTLKKVEIHYDITAPLDEDEWPRDDNIS